VSDQPADERDPRLAILSCLLAAAVYTWLAWPTWDTVVDDAYISARYAEQLAAGNGVVYNAGQPAVEGVTNLAWTFLLAFGRLLGLPMLGMMTTLGWLFTVLAIVGAALVARALSGTNDVRITTGSWLLALSPHVAVAGTNGLESTMMGAVSLGATWAHLTLTGRGRWVAGALAALLVWTRPEGIAVVLALVAHDLWTHRQNLREALPFTLTALGAQLLLTVWRLWTYGAWLPNTFAAKSSFPLHTTLTVNGAYLEPEIPTLAAFGCALIIASVSPPHTLKKALVACIAAGLAAIPFTVNMWMPGLRLFFPAMSVIAALIAVPVARARPGLGWAAMLALTGAMAAFIQTDGARVAHYDWRHTVAPRNATQLAAEHLAAHAPPGAWLATRDAGVFAYYVGTNVNVAELHQRALTLPHPNGDNADLRSNTPLNPEFFAATVRRDNTPEFIYSGDKLVYNRVTEPYVYLGRVKQHYHRYYDVYARADLNVPPLPEEVVENFNGPRQMPKPKAVGEREPREAEGEPADQD
jgi:arabinofuranosyltransferase